MTTAVGYHSNVLPFEAPKSHFLECLVSAAIELEPLAMIVVLVDLGISVSTSTSGGSNHPMVAH